METKRLKVKLTFTEPILGTSPADADIYRRFIGGKSPDAANIEEEVEALGADAVAERGMTVFPKEDGYPFLWDYQIRGFFKGAASALRKAKKSKTSKLKAHKKIIDQLVFVSPRRVPILFEGEIGECQRPLRASTPQGERVSLANSEEIPAGATVSFFVECLDPDLLEYVREWLDYGRLSGIGQWRNSGKGRFTWEEF